MNIYQRIVLILGSIVLVLNTFGRPIAVDVGMAVQYAVVGLAIAGATFLIIKLCGNKGDNNESQMPKLRRCLSNR